jgi:hypothetical protein
MLNCAAMSNNKYTGKEVLVLVYVFLAVVITGFSSLYRSNVISIRTESPAVNLMTRSPISNCELISGLPSYGWPFKYVTGTGECPGTYKYLLPLALLGDIIFYFIVICLLGSTVQKTVRKHHPK